MEVAVSLVAGEVWDMEWVVADVTVPIQVMQAMDEALAGWAWAQDLDTEVEDGDIIKR